MKRFIWRLFKLGVGIFLAFHVYALALKFIPVPGTVLMVQRGLSGEDVRRDWTKLEDISPYIIDAVIGAEDGRFCEHHGLDFEAIEQAFEDNQDNGKRRGGSTITQQTAKNVFFWNGGGYIRKAGEAWMASFIDYVWGKRRTIEVYLNVAEWGDGIFGIEAAAQNRFGKPASDLTQQEAALLAAVLPNPHKWRVDPPGPYVQGRAGTLRQRMRVVRDSQYSACVTGQADYPYSAPKPKPPEPKSEPEQPPEPETMQDGNPEVIEREAEDMPVEPAEDGIESEPVPELPMESSEEPAPAPESESEPEPTTEASKPQPDVLSEVDIMEMDSGDKAPPPPEEEDAPTERPE